MYPSFSTNFRAVNARFIKYAQFTQNIVFIFHLGVITTLIPLDREKTSSYTLLVIAKDLGTPSLNATTPLIVNVSDINDNHPIFDPNSLHGNVTEERKGGEFVTRLVATDSDIGPNAEIVYSLDSFAQTFLHVHPLTGNVTTRGPFDFEMKRNYTFNVIASDKGS